MRLYIHWPFCLSRCSYCDFTARVASGEVMARYLEALVAEIRRWSEVMDKDGRSLQSIYVGGGTPSTMGPGDAGFLLDRVAFYFSVSSCKEITFEVNPATWTRRDFQAARTAGVNRFSIGVQSFHGGTLLLLGRAHNAAEAARALKNALRVVEATVSADLIYAVPGEAEGRFKETLDRVIRLGAHHISIYTLTLEEGTPLTGRVDRGEVTRPEDDRAADQYLWACDRLSASGYRQYEISNFAMPGHECRHNQGYWRREEYLGIGAGAHSLLGRYRFSNQDSLLGYMQKVEREGLAVQSIEIISELEEREEEVMLGLRTSRGVPESLLPGAGRSLCYLKEEGLLQKKGERIVLTPRGMAVSNAVIAEVLCA